jgi:hypothetical protein
MTIIQVTNQTVPAARPARQRCDHCGGSFGLVTHRWWDSKFCKRRCKEAHIREIMLDRRTIHRWCGFLGRQAIPMVPRFGWNRSWGLRSLVCAGLVLIVVAPVSKLEAGFAVSPSTFKPPTFAGQMHVRLGRGLRSPTRFVVPTSINFTRRYRLAKRYLNAPRTGVRKTSKCSTGRSKPSTI